MASVKGPLFSFEASGSLKKIITFSQWKGRNYVRTHTIPFNPNTANQINVRKAFNLTVAYWQTQAAPDKLLWDEFAKQFQMAGFNKFLSRAMKAYVDQLTSGGDPQSVTVAGDPPADVWTWVVVP